MHDMVIRLCARTVSRDHHARSYAICKLCYEKYRISDAWSFTHQSHHFKELQNSCIIYSVLIVVIAHESGIIHKSQSSHLQTDMWLSFPDRETHFPLPDRGIHPTAELQPACIISCVESVTDNTFILYPYLAQRRPLKSTKSSIIQAEAQCPPSTLKSVPVINPLPSASIYTVGALKSSGTPSRPSSAPRIQVSSTSGFS